MTLQLVQELLEVCLDEIRQKPNDPELAIVELDLQAVRDKLQEYNVLNPGV